jgi:membrane dipeptidase
VVADAHNDLLMLVTRRPTQQWSSYFRESVLPQLRRGGVDLQVLPVFVDDEFRPELGLRQMLRMIEAAHRIAEDNADEVRLCTTSDDIDDALADGRIALVLAVEGCGPLAEDVALLRTLHRLGVRIASLTHLGRTALADGSGEDAAGSRLTSLGVDAVRAMEEFGITLDVSHLGRAGLDHVLEIARRPIMATHSSAFALVPHHRNLRDEHLAGIARLDGVVCVNLYPSFLADPDLGPATLDHVGRHVEHLLAAVGPGRVGLGPDFIHEYYAEVGPVARAAMLGHEENIAVVPGLEGPEGLPLLTEHLLERGLPVDVVTGVIGDNLRAFLRRVLPPRPGAAPPIPYEGGSAMAQHNDSRPESSR